MAGVFKPITAKSITQHTAHKEYDLTFPIADKFATFDGVNAYYHSATSRNLVDGRLQDYPAADAVSSNGVSYISDNATLLSDQDVYNGIRGKYIVPEFLPGHKGIRWSSLASMSVFSVPKEHYGERIKPGTVELTLDGGAETFTDGEGKGYLCNANTVQSQSRVIFHLNVPFLENTTRGEIPFDWSYNVDGADTSLVDAKGYNLSFDSARHNTHTTWLTHIQGVSTRNVSAVTFSQSAATAQLWQKSVQPKPTDSVVWLDSLPRTAFYHTDQFEGLTIYAYGRLDNVGNGDTVQTIFQLGPAMGAKEAPLLIYIEGDKIKVKVGNRTPQETSAVFTNLDTFAIAVSVMPNGTVHVRAYDHTNGADAPVADITLSDEELRSINVFNPEHRYGCIGAAFKLQEPASGTYDAAQLDPGPGTARKDVQFSNRFGGQSMDFRIYNAGVPDSAASLLVIKPHDQMIGNVYYDEGVIVLNGLDENQVWNSGNATLGFKNTVYREEYEYLCQIQETEFNMSQNQTILQSGSTADNPVVASFVSSSGWDPYITTIGLYNEYHELMAVGKLGRPIRKVEDYDLSFVVRFDV